MLSIIVVVVSILPVRYHATPDFRNSCAIFAIAICVGIGVPAWRIRKQCANLLAFVPVAPIVWQVRALPKDTGIPGISAFLCWSLGGLAEASVRRLVFPTYKRWGLSAQPGLTRLLQGLKASAQFSARVPPRDSEGVVSGGVLSILRLVLSVAGCGLCAPLSASLWSSGVCRSRSGRRRRYAAEAAPSVPGGALALASGKRDLNHERSARSAHGCARARERASKPHPAAQEERLRRQARHHDDRKAAAEDRALSTAPVALPWHRRSSCIGRLRPSFRWR